MSNDLQSQYSDIIFYASPEGNIRVEVLFSDETYWLSQKRMSELFGVEVNTINYHLKEVFKSAELQEDSVIRKIRITAEDGKDYLTSVRIISMNFWNAFGRYGQVKDDFTRKSQIFTNRAALITIKMLR